MEEKTKLRVHKIFRGNKSEIIYTSPQIVQGLGILNGFEAANRHIRCIKCLKKGHSYFNCIFKAKQFPCVLCGNKDHKYYDCPQSI